MINIMQNKYRPLYAGINFSLFLVLAFSIHFNLAWVKVFDDTIRHFLGQFITPSHTKIVIFLTNLGSPSVSFVFSLLICFLVWKKHDLVDATWASLVIISFNLTNFIVKNIVQRKRPTDKLIPQAGFSFPSGHTFGTALFVFLVCLLLVPHIKSRLLRWIVDGLGFLWIIIIALTRIYLHVHFPSDTLGSVLLVFSLWEIALPISYHWQHKYRS
ncbi:undecaprenyl-diphosphatase [Ligilactobacillus sp. WC1T17]|uniref:Undecaprenyl-diphosphatase n=1 Tax=Ligilactobacillus ruminis TaxID=1623 RepID=A0ABY1ACX7_9LACO|nr:undecaprenyl-diphosphatase [Ligilactobacillus ruminis]